MDEFKANLKNLYKMASAWVMFLLTSATAYWLTLPLETQVQMQQDFPVLKYGMLGAAFVSFAIARAAPQPWLRPQEPDGTMLDEVPKGK